MGVFHRLNIALNGAQSKFHIHLQKYFGFNALLIGYEKKAQR